mgnify:CR=1 FL=1
MPDPDQRPYKTQVECQKNEWINDGWMSVNAQGHKESCLYSGTNEACEKGSPGCTCYQDKVCVKANGPPDQAVPDEWGNKNACKIDDDDCFLSEWGCWNHNNPMRWKCDIRGMGCSRVQCDPGDTSCFDTQEECEQGCHAYCSEVNGCIQTTNCVPSKLHPGRLVTTNADGSVNENDQCFKGIEECAKNCKNVECKSSIFYPDTPEFCRFGICDPNDKDCLDSDIDQVYQSCLKGDCGIYKCTGFGKEKTCAIADGSGWAGSCNPATDSNCYKGLKECVSNCKESENSFMCSGNGTFCEQLMDKDKKKCPKKGQNSKDGIKCFDSLDFCEANCGDDKKSTMGFTAYNNCTDKVACNGNAFMGAAQGWWGGEPVCHETKKACKASSKKLEPTMYNPGTNSCIKLGKQQGCNLVDNKNCYSSPTVCELANNLPFT